jgi:ADP-heptose:LPS heptosyltransferase
VNEDILGWEGDNRGMQKYYERSGKLGVERIGILRALNLGDLLCTTPAFRALRAAFPRAQITLVGLPRAKSFVDRFRLYLDDFLELPGFPGFPEIRPDIHAFPQFLSDVQWLNFDLALQMQGSGAISNPLIALFGAADCAGFYLTGQYCPDEKLFIEYPVNESEVHIHLSLMKHLGIPLQGDHLEFPLFVEDWEEYHHIKTKFGLENGQFVCIHPGARDPRRRWPIEYFASVANSVFERGMQVVLTGTHDEASLTEAVAAKMQAPSINLAGKTSLGGLGTLLARSRLLVSNDTGVSHMAAALRLPSVILFTVSDPTRWAPLDKHLHRSVAWASAATPEIILDEVEVLLSEERVYAT